MIERNNAAECVRVIREIERLGAMGLVISVAYGPCGDYGLQYSVTAMESSTGREFDKPFGVSSFEDISLVLENEIPAFINGSP